MLRLRVLIALVGCLALAGSASANTIVIDFESDTTGSKPNGFMSADSALVSFTDTMGADLFLDDYGVQSNGQALGVFDDVDGSELLINLAFPADAIWLDFGNDDPAFTNPGDLAVLTLFDGVAQVAQTTVVLNRNDLMDQTIGFSGVLFDTAVFAYTDPALMPFTGGNGVNTGLIEVVDNIRVDLIPEPSSVALFGVSLLIAHLGVSRRSKRA